MHETGDIRLRGVLLGGMAIVVAVALAATSAYFLWQRWNAPSGAQPFGGPNTGNLPRVAGPALESAPQPDRKRYFDEQKKRLESWGWIDRRAGIAHIPLDEAMRIMAARGDEGPASAPKEQP